MTRQAVGSTAIQRRAVTRLPTADGIFRLSLYVSERDGKEHVALVRGDVEGRENVLVRIHSECFTGDVLGSRRCDCGEQLQKAQRLISQEEAGVLVYLRQEGRGIGLTGKLHAYNLQDAGYDTVDANVLLGYRPDERDYTVAALILKDLGVRSIRLLTNNPHKIESLKGMGVTVKERVPIVGGVYPQNRGYLITKIRKMNHLLGEGNQSLARRPPGKGNPAQAVPTLVTLCYAQSVDGCVAAVEGKRLEISGRESIEYVHQLRAAHDAILVGIGTVISDDPRLTVRHGAGRDPQPVVLDTLLRFPASAYLLNGHPLRPWIAASSYADPGRRALLERKGARVIPLPLDGAGGVSLEALLEELHKAGIRNLMVEGGARVITSFLSRRLVDRIVVTVSPVMLGGLPALARGGGIPAPFKLRNVFTRRMGQDLVLEGEPLWSVP